MKTKTSFSNLVLNAGIVLSLLVACRPAAVTPNEEATIPPTVEIVIESTSTPQPTSTTQLPPTKSPLTSLTQTINDIAITISNFRLENNQIRMDTCYDLPDNGDWIIWEATLKIGDTITKNNFGTDLMSLQEAVGTQKGQRCDTVYFDRMYLSPTADLPDITFSIDTIAANVEEGGECSPEYLARYQKALDQRDTGLTVECFVEELEGGGGMSGVRVASKPDTMSQEDAEALLNSYDLFLDVHGLRGPWVFNFSLSR
jgi:hypothetical protein